MVDEAWERLRVAAPRVPEEEQVRDLLAELAVAIRQGEPAPRRRVHGWPRRGRRLLITGFAAGTVLCTAAGYTVWYDTRSPDMAAAVQSYAARTPLPPGTDVEAYVTDLRRQGAQRPAEISDEAVSNMVSYFGFCAWLTAWDRRTVAGDAPGTQQAATSLQRAATAPGLRARDGGGVVANLEQVTEAARNGDRSRVAAELQNNCSGLPLAGIR